MGTSSMKMLSASTPMLMLPASTGTQPPLISGTRIMPSYPGYGSRFYGGPGGTIIDVEPVRERGWVKYQERGLVRYQAPQKPNLNITPKGRWSGKTGKFLRNAYKGWGGVANLAFIGLGIYQGYQEDGITGALSYGVQGFGFDLMLRAAGGGPVMLGAALAIGAGVGGYNALSAGQSYYRQQRRFDISNGGFIDTFGTAATMRQRSLAAMSQSHTNMRTALGNEALYFHR